MKAVTFLALLAAAPVVAGFGPYRPAAMGAVALGVGDALTAAGTGTAALYANPAAMAQVPQQAFDGGFQHNGQAGTSSVYGSAVDATSAWGLAGGVGYAKDVNWGVDRPLRDASDFRAGLALGTTNDVGRLMIGASARWLSVDTFAPQKARSITQWTGDLGVDVAAGSLRLGAALRNGLKPDVGEAPRRVAMGVGFVASSGLIEADGSWGVANPTAPAGVVAMTGQVYRVGGGWQFGDEGLQVRAGYVFDQAQVGHATRHLVCGGLGWHTTQVAVDVSTSVNVRDPSEMIIAAGLTWVLPLEAN